MSNTFLCSDLHLGHRGIVQFLRADGITKERPWDNLEDMNEALIKNWNDTVRPKDTVYNLGDVTINRSALPLLARLNGTKMLVAGNHDVHHTHEYMQYFKSIHGTRSLDGFICSHMPIHVDSIERWKGCIHGHLHSDRVRMPDGSIDPRYLCVSMEHINYTPISLDEVNRRFKEQQEN